MRASNRRSTLLALALVASACSFPDVEINGGGGETSGSTGTMTSGQTSSSSTVVGSGATSSSTGIAPCDADGDLVQREGPGCCELGPTMCDCDDDNVDVHAGQTMYFDVPREGVPGVLAFDYDCSMAIERDPIQKIGGCGELGTCVAGDTKEVFLPDDAQPTCGGMGTRRYCAGTSCDQDPTKRTLRCH